jgi:phage host-nuclease inhibitor protein Gam
MNLLGKIFTFAILFASILVLVVAVAVYGTHKNWQTEYTNLNAKYTTAQAANADLEAKYLAQISQLKADQEAAQQEVRKLESERVALVNQNAGIQKEVDQLRGERRANEALVAATEENNNRLTEEVTKLRDAIRTHQQARDDAFRQVTKATSDLHLTAGQLQQLQERNAQIVQDLANKTAMLRESGLDLNAAVVPRVRGKVSFTERRNGVQLIEITIGSDDGVRPEMTVDVFRGARYLGRAKILRADPDRAVGQLLREFQQGQIQEGDDVATKFRVG